MLMLFGETKYCRGCETDKPILCFTMRSSGYRISRCDVCNQGDCKRWRKANPEKVRAQYRDNKKAIAVYARERYQRKRMAFKIYSLLRNYGLTLDDVRAMAKRQKYCCAICGRRCRLDLMPKRGRGAKAGAFVVDHCHKSGIVRGLLCTGCNVAIGMLKDCPKLLKKAIAYLESVR